MIPVILIYGGGRSIVVDGNRDIRQLSGSGRFGGSGDGNGIGDGDGDGNGEGEDEVQSATTMPTITAAVAAKMRHRQILVCRIQN